MTHDDALALLPVYALGALDDDAASLEAHLDSCAICRHTLAEYLEATAAMGGAVEQVAPPPRLRARVLATPAGRPLPGHWRWPAQYTALAVAALVLLAVGLASWAGVQRAQLQHAQATLALDERGLALLTSTETTVVRLDPLVSSTQAHGHWYHRPGIMTQVLVVEFMPAPTPGHGYDAWLQHTNGSWQLAGRFTLDATGYGRLVLLGSDGADVQRVEVREEAQAGTAPGGQLILRWP